MAISVSLVLDAGVILVGQPKRAAVTVTNTEGFDIDIVGIDVNDALRSLTCGDFIPGLPVTFDVTSVASPVLSQIPAWGTGDQSSTTTTGVDLLYPYQNFDSVTQTITNNLGSYAGGSTTPNTVRIANGTSMTSYVDLISSGQNILETALPTSLQAIVQAEVSSTGAALPLAYSSVVGTVISTKPVSGIRLSPINTTPLIVRNVWSRPQEYSNFDVALQTLLVFTDSTTLDVTGLPGHVFTSSATGNWTVVASALYGSTAPAAIPSVTPSQATPSFPVGSIPPGGWQGTKLVGGAGACTAGASTNSVLTSTITDTYLGSYVATQVLGHTLRLVVGVTVSPVLSQLVGVGNSVDLTTRMVYNDGTLSATLEGTGTPPLYSIVGANSGLATVNATTGVVTQNTAGLSNIVIKSSISYDNGDGSGARPYDAYANIATV